MNHKKRSVPVTVFQKALLFLDTKSLKDMFLRISLFHLHNKRRYRTINIAFNQKKEWGLIMSYGMT